MSQTWPTDLQPLPPATPFQRIIKRLAATRPIAWLLAHTLQTLDKFILYLTSGRTTATSLLTGLPVVFLTTRGAKSGLERTHPLIAVVDGARIVLFATNFGEKKHPAWYHNLRANPQVRLKIAGNTRPYTARLATETEKVRYWPLADSMYIGYAAYRQRAGTYRQIPVIILDPDAEI